MYAKTQREDPPKLNLLIPVIHKLYIYKFSKFSILQILLYFFLLIVILWNHS